MFNELAALYTEQVALFVASVFILGLVVGSFLNVVIYRLPIMLEREWREQASEILEPVSPTTGFAETVQPDRITLSVPRSACPICKARISAWQNIPIISWVLLRGKCASCNASISYRYPLVELATGLLSAAVAWHFGFGQTAACALVITWTLIALAGIDVDHQLLPDSMTLPLMWLGLLAAALDDSSIGHSVPVSPHDAIIGAAAGYLSLWSVFHLFRLVTGKEGMGYGDFKLLGALGAWLGWKLLPLVILVAAATGAIFGMLMIALRGRDRAAPMPFGPYLAAAGWIAMLYGDRLVDGYLRLSGLQR
jgi:leader peptidase (prepilin peptidase)/N-methyltransferase